MSTDVGMSATTGRSISGAEHLQQSIGLLLSTLIGTRIARRSVGSLLPELIDHPDNAITRAKLFSATAGALMRWEPRIRASKIELVSPSAGSVSIVINGTYIPPNGTPQQLLSLRVPIQQQAAT